MRITARWRVWLQKPRVPVTWQRHHPGAGAACLSALKARAIFSCRTRRKAFRSIIPRKQECRETLDSAQRWSRKMACCQLPDSTSAKCCSLRTENLEKKKCTQQVEAHLDPRVARFCKLKIRILMPARSSRGIRHSCEVKSQQSCKGRRHEEQRCP